MIARSNATFKILSDFYIQVNKLHFANTLMIPEIQTR